jgi:hypothetical protein
MHHLFCCGTGFERATVQEKIEMGRIREALLQRVTRRPRRRLQQQGQRLRDLLQHCTLQQLHKHAGCFLGLTGFQ